MGLYKKNAFGFNFEPQEVPQPKMHKSESAHFLDWALAKVPN